MTAMYLCAASAVVGDGLDVGALVARTLSELQMSQKEAGIICGYPATDRSGLSRALIGEQPLDLWRLRHLPVLFWQRFLPMLAAALIQQWFADLLSDQKRSA